MVCHVCVLCVYCVCNVYVLYVYMLNIVLIKLMGKVIVVKLFVNVKGNMRLTM